MKKTTKERTGKVKINERRALNLLENYVSKRIKPKDEEERKILNQLLAAALERLAPGEEKEATLPVPGEINLTAKDKKEILSWKPPTTTYLKLPSKLINTPEISKNQKGENGTLMSEYHQKGIPFLVSPFGTLTLTGKKLLYGIIPNLMKDYKGIKTGKANTHEIIKKANLKEGGNTYKEIDEEFFKIAHYFSHNFITDTDTTGKREIEKGIEGTPLFLYFKETRKKGEKESNWIFMGNPGLNSILWNQLKAGYRLKNILKARNKHELPLYIFLKSKVKPGGKPFAIGEDKLIGYAEIHAEKKIHQRRDLKTALENLEKDYGFLYGKNKNNIYFLYLPREPISEKERDQIIKLLNQGKSPTGENIMEEWKKDQKEKEKNKKEKAQNRTRKIRIQAELHKAGIKIDQINEIINRCGIDYLEKILKKEKSKNPRNPAGYLLHKINKCMKN